MMKALCCGDRNWTNVDAVWRELRALRDAGYTDVVEGEARGADILCGTVAYQLGMTVHRHPADWTRFKKAAGPIRNQAMLDAHPDIQLVLAFHPDLKQSKGTGDMVRRARLAGIPVRVIDS